MQSILTELLIAFDGPLANDANISDHYEVLHKTQFGLPPDRLAKCGTKKTLIELANFYKEFNIYPKSIFGLIGF
jgi:hypothetical protein